MVPNIIINGLGDNLRTIEKKSKIAVFTKIAGSDH